MINRGKGYSIEEEWSEEEEYSGEEECNGEEECSGGRGAVRRRSAGKTGVFSLSVWSGATLSRNGIIMMPVSGFDGYA